LFKKYVKMTERVGRCAVHKYCNEARLLAVITKPMKRVLYVRDKYKFGNVFTSQLWISFAHLCNGSSLFQFPRRRVFNTQSIILTFSNASKASAVTFLERLGSKFSPTKPSYNRHSHSKVEFAQYPSEEFLALA
jgi:hypothetical protein